MKTTIRLEQVSKKYNLGLTRTSLPSIISKWLKKTVRYTSPESDRVKSLWAVKDISFELKQGQSLALIGPNGAGKTTILKLLANITKPTSGQIEIMGQLSALIELGAGFHPDLTGRENIYLNGAILGLSRKYITQRFDEIVDFSEIEHFIDTPVKRYSSGMKVRLGFAVAACIEPDILLVDEVLAVGDASFRQKCTNRIKELLDMGTSIIFVSHNLWLVQSVCSSALYIDKGQIKYRGQTTEAIKLYDRDLNEKRAQKFETSQLTPQDIAAEVEITTIEVLGRDNQQSDKLRNDLPAEIRIHYLAYNVLEAVNVVVRILRSDGLTCCMMRTNLDNVQVSLERGPGVISVVLDPLQLRGGSYFAQVMIRDSNDAETITSGNSEWFYVSGSILTFHEMNGVFEPKRTWTYYRLSQPSNGSGREDQLDRIER